MLANNVRSAVIASTIAAAALAPVRSANAQLVSINGFNNFHVEETPATPQTSNPYQCVFEDNGAVYNNSTYKVTLDFNLPVSTEGGHTIYIRNYWNHTAGTSFNCIVYACPTSLTDHLCVVGGIGDIHRAVPTKVGLSRHQRRISEYAEYGADMLEPVNRGRDRHHELSSLRRLQRSSGAAAQSLAELRRHGFDW